MAESNDNTTCVVCFKNVTFYSIGECDHPVCFECSTRMRVLCLQNECPICRQDLSRVVFTEQVLPYKELRNTVFTDRQFERQFKIGFCTEEIKNAYDILLENRCKLCQKIAPFRTFTMLSDHMRKVHERFFCDLCVKHLKIFTCERKCYTRQELAHHRRKGDLDDTSHRGHPLCEFCEERFMDADELYRHLRKEHLYCHLCDADGRNLYYATHAALAHHFRSDHYLCEEGDCAGQHLTAVFRSEIDLKAHKATVHGRGLNRGAARQARTLELQFNITPHSVVTRTTPRDRERAVTPPPTPPPAADIDTRSDQHFPRLSAAAPQQNIMLGAVARAYKGAGGLARTDKNFPTLGGGGASTNPTPAQGPQPAAAIMRNSKPSVSIQLRSQPASASNFRLTQPTGNRISVPPQKKPSPLTDDDFPSLSMGKDDYPSIGAGTMQPPKVTMINSQEMQALKSKPSQSQPKKSQLSSEAFPALSSSSAPATTPQWITVSKPKEKAKPKAEPPPKPKTFNQVADFPGLPANTTNNNKSKAKKIPAPQPTPSIQSDNKSKKEKKKQNNNAKKENFSEPNLVNGIEDIKNYDMAYVLATVNNNQNAEVDKKIKTLENTSTSDKKKGNGDFSLKTMEYPPLNSRNENLPEKKVTSYPERKKQPERKMNGSVPPGFGSRATCNGMTFTNSSGQTFSAPLHSYIAPPNFEARNRALVKKFTDALGSAAAVDDFKVASRAFRDNIISAEEFYQHCKTAMGSKLDSVFSELVALLPDIGKQQEMVVGRSSTLELEACDTCGQLFASADKVSHETAHWPPLAPR